MNYNLVPLFRQCETVTILVFNVAQPGIGRVQVFGSKKFLWEELYVSLYAQGLKIVGR